jgi:hypothetical protein
MPDHCPACAARLQVTSLTCPSCATRIEGTFESCPLCSLDGDDRALLELFLRARGNAKEVERALGVSYPTVRARLERLWTRLDLGDASPAATDRPAMAILADLRAGKISVPEALEALRRRGRPPAGSA